MRCQWVMSFFDDGEKKQVIIPLFLGYIALLNRELLWQADQAI
jgi:hypothetical protein